MKEKSVKHPAYGYIRVNKVCGDANLFCSDLVHRHSVSIEIGEAELVDQYENSASKRHVAGRCVLRVSMSESQFARLITSFGAGEGVPCTIERRDGQAVERLPSPRSVSDANISAVSGRLANAVEMLGKLRRSIEERFPRGSQRGLVDTGKDIDQIVYEISSNIEFTLEDFKKKMESTVNDAKLEIETYIAFESLMRGLEQGDTSHMLNAEANDTPNLTSMERFE